MNIVLIGAGSRSFGRCQIVDLLSERELNGTGLTFWLVDVNEAALNLMTEFARKVKAHTGSDAVIKSTTDRCTALPGADFVITSVAVQRNALWDQDFCIPLSYGFRHCLGENGGPGAAFHALRSFELILPICRDAEALCPDAILFNFTNPEARVLHAISTLTHVKAFGICHGFHSARRQITRLLARPLDDLDIVSAGMNHFYQVLKVADRKTGADLLPDLLEKARADEEIARHEPLFARFVRHFDMFTYCSDDHIGEYVAYGSEFLGPNWLYGRPGKRPAKLRLNGGGNGTARPARLEDYASGTTPLDEQVLKRSGEITVPMIRDITLGREAEYPAVNVLNAEAYIDNLPATGVVEVPARVDAAGVHPLKVGSMPEPAASIIRLHHSIISLVTEAYRTQSRKRLLQALLLDPNVNSIANAERLLDHMFNLQEDFLPALS
ncbi:MAG: hypothetical protein JXR37_19815 [Kiritimatiellae bacterium]|nr:hypothetical protein [Kiritimatiellia bacterium]